MCFISILLILVLIIVFTCTYIIDVSSLRTVKEVCDIDPTLIKELSEQYVDSLGVEKIEIPIIYKFVRYKNSYDKEHNLLGTFHKWHNAYYIDINSDLLQNQDKLKSIVIHETRHLIVAYLKDKDIIDLEEYTEEIAEEINSYYNNLFDSGVYLLKTNGPNHEVLIQE